MIFNKELIHDPLLILNSDYTVNSANRAMIETFAQENTESINLTIDEIFSNPNTKAQMLQALKNAEKSGIERLNIAINLNNRSVDFFITFYGPDQQENDKFIVIFIDISKQKKNERTLRIQNQLEEKEKHMASLKILSEGVAHEINNPNNVIMMNVLILQKIIEDLLPILNSSDLKGQMFGGFNAETVNDKMKIMAEGIHYGAKRIKTITSELRDYSIKDSGEFKKIDINEIITSSLSSLEHSLNNKVSKLIINLNQKEPLYIRGISYKIKEAIVNLILNSCESLTKSEKKLTVNSHIDYKISKIVILITDSGIGMDKKTMEHIKDPFFTTKRDNGAIGLGLSIANRIIGEHNGNLVLISEPDSGTTAIIQLPLWEDLKL